MTGRVKPRSGSLPLSSLFIGLFILLILNWSFAPMWAKLLNVPRPYLYAGIAVLSMLGVYAIVSSLLDLWLVLGLGLLGFMMRRYNIPVAPVLIAVVLGPMAETELRRALAVSEGDMTVLIGSPFTITVYLLLGIAMAVTAVQHIRNRASQKAAATAPAAHREEEEVTAGV